MRAVEIAPPCNTLARWDGRFDVASRGALVFRELLSRFAYPDFLDAGALFARPFDPADPIGTPAGLAPPRGDGTDPVLEALARGVRLLETFGIPVDAPLGDWQYALRGAAPIPIHGGLGDEEGIANAVAAALTSIVTSLEPTDLVTGGRRDADIVFRAPSARAAIRSPSARASSR